MKEFNLEEAKAGKPVCTRDGRKVRIICFDAKSSFSIVGLATDKYNQEYVHCWCEDGHWDTDVENHYLDLMMAPEKHEGWMNIYQSTDRTSGSIIYPTKEEALKDRHRNAVATIHIEWEKELWKVSR